jgi:hypothetical protein
MKGSRILSIHCEASVRSVAKGRSSVKLKMPKTREACLTNVAVQVCSGAVPTEICQQLHSKISGSDLALNSSTALAVGMILHSDPEYSYASP